MPGKPAARVTDMAGHLGVIVIGSSTVLIGGQPAARLGDSLTCPGFDGPKAHVMGNIVTASASVMIDGAFAARQGDTTGCGLAGLSGKGLPAVTGPPPPSGDSPPKITETDHTMEELKYEEKTPYGSKKSALGLYESKSTDYKDGYKDESKVALIHRDRTSIDGDTTSSYQFEVGAMDAEVHEGAVGGGGSVQAAAMEGKYEVSDKAGDNKTSIEGSVGKVAIGAEASGGKEGAKTAVNGSIKAQASLFDIAASAKRTYHIPWTDWNFQVAGKVSAGYGMGASYQAGAAYDATDGSYHVTQEGMRDIGDMKKKEEIMKKLKPHWSWDWDITDFGLRPTPGVGMPGTPGSITTGCFTVLIG